MHLKELPKDTKLYHEFEDGSKTARVFKSFEEYTICFTKNKHNYSLPSSSEVENYKDGYKLKP